MDTPIQTTTAPPAPDDDVGVEMQIDFLVDQASGEGSLVLTRVDGSGAIEVPFDRESARQLIAAMAEYCWPGSRLASAPAASSA